MARTTVPGNRIAEGAIENKHLHPDFKISEENIQFKLDPHEHKNKSVLDVLRNSIPQTLTLLDLKDVMYTILEVSDARDVNKTLRQTLDGKATVDEINLLVDEITEARRGFASLNEFFVELERELDQTIADHMGAISHQELDAIYSEVRAARGIHTSLKDRLDDMAMNGGGGGTGGPTTIHMLTPWVMDYDLEAGKTLVPLINSYTPGNSTLQVFEGPILLQADIDYIEKSPTEIELIEAFDVDVKLRIIGVNTGRLFEWERRISGNGAITRVDLADSYRPGHRELLIYEDGILLREDEDYVELSPNSLRFNIAIPTGSTVTIYKRRN